MPIGNVPNSSTGVKRRFLSLPPGIMLDPELSPTAKVVYAILVNAHFEGEDIVISLERIAQHLGRDRRAALRGIAELKKATLIRQEPSHMRCNVNRYVLSCTEMVTTRQTKRPASPRGEAPFGSDQEPVSPEERNRNIVRLNEIAKSVGRRRAIPADDDAPATTLLAG